MKRSGSDYWPLYHDDFWGDPEVLKLNANGKALYLFLLGLQWKYGSIPADPRPLIYGFAPGELRLLSRVLDAHFALNIDGTRTNHRLRMEMDRVEENRAGARSRAEKSRDVRARNRTEERRGEEKRVEEVEEATPPPAAQRPRRVVEINAEPTPHVQVREFFCAAFERLKGTKYAFAGGKDGKHVKTLLDVSHAAGNVAEVQRRAEALFADAWANSESRVPDLGMLVARWNKYPPQNGRHVQAAPQALALFEQSPEGRAALERELQREQRRAEARQVESA